MHPAIQLKAEQISNGATYTGSAVAATSGVWAWLGAHYQAIGALVALGGLIIAGLGLIASIYFQYRQTRAIEKRNIK